MNTNKTFTYQERLPDEGYRTNRIAIDGTITQAADPLAALSTQELVSLAAQMEAEDASKQAYWKRFTRTHEEV